MNGWHRARALTALLLTGCGGGMPSNAPAAPPGAYPEPSPQEQQQQGYPAPRDEEGGYAQPPAADRAGPDVKGKDDDLAAADLEFDRAASELSAAGADCPRACKALDSMSRASERICALDPDESSGRCRRAKERFAEAAGKVRRSCACP